MLASVVEAAKRRTRATWTEIKLWPPIRLWGILARRLGYRGLALVLFALAFVGIGVGLPSAPPAPPELLYSLIPLPIRVGVWIGCGVVALAGALSHRETWQDRGFAVLLVPLLGERLLSYVGAVLVEDDTLRWFSGGFVWFLFSGLVTLIAAWPEPTTATDPPPTPPLMPEVP